MEQFRGIGINIDPNWKKTYHYENGFFDTVDGMDNSLRPDVNAVRCTACSF